MRDTTNLDKPWPLNSFVLPRTFRAVHFSDKLKQLRNGPFKMLNHLKDVTNELLAKHDYTFQWHSNNPIPSYPPEPVIFSHTQSNNQENPLTSQDFNISGTIRNILFTSTDKSDFDDIVSDDDPLLEDHDDTSIMPDSEWYKSMNSDDFHHSSRSKSQSKEIYQKPKTSTFKTFYKFTEISDFLILALFLTPLHDPMTNQTFHCNLNNHKLPREIPKPIMSCDHDRKKNIVFFFHSSITFYIWEKTPFLLNSNCN